ncbi:UxaA family hydrolase, partial [Pseudomonas aeruginosa]|uniref:UxaA family hydrolase n=1 Tax=Pseudomonas aeruginosa TaxID=287 RepID=UPI00214B08E0
IPLHPSDNCGVVVNDQGVAAGGRFDDGLTAIEGIPQSHKVALVDIAEGGEVVRYGEVIGYALKPIAAGSWVTEQVLRMPEPPALDNLAKATIKAAPGEPR